MSSRLRKFLASFRFETRVRARLIVVPEQASACGVVVENQRNPLCRRPARSSRIRSEAMIIKGGDIFPQFLYSCRTLNPYRFITLILFLVAPALAQQPKLQNAKLETISASAGLRQTIDPIIQKHAGPLWIG